ncbi:unnamed protein product [Parnassius apollo]|uniref:(apollo) hypothetical protein n=1 Tax=Parnassius apollo TaxID=110799 RepID=A0A8S3XMX6_PARAO|nr:unnamed protein product [Parnassius apollo]
MKSEILLLRLKVKYLELETRKNNVLLHGVEETENNNLELMNTVIELFNVPCTKNKRRKRNTTGINGNLAAYIELGKKTEGKIRPIKISCTLTWRRNEILKKKKKFPEGVYVTEDLSKEELEERKTLIPKMKEARASGKYATIRNGKLIIRDKMEPEKRKRTQSTPPSTPPDNFSKARGEPKLYQPAKMSRINPAERMRSQSNSNTEETSKN